MCARTMKGVSGNTTDVARASTKKSSNGMMRRLYGSGVAAGGRRRLLPVGWGIAHCLHLLERAGLAAAGVALSSNVCAGDS